MLLSAVSVLDVAQSSSEIPEGLINNPVYPYCAQTSSSTSAAFTYILTVLKPVPPLLLHIHVSLLCSNQFLHFCCIYIYPYCAQTSSSTSAAYTCILTVLKPVPPLMLHLHISLLCSAIYYQRHGCHFNHFQILCTIFWQTALLCTLLPTVVGLLCIELLSCVYFCYLMCIVLLCVCVLLYFSCQIAG